jgi:hypothetical protein
MASPFSNIRGEFLSMDLSSLGKLYSFFQKAPQMLRPVTAQFLNDLGFNLRPLIVSTLAGRLIMRNPRFVLSRMQVVKTSAKPIPQQRVTVGSTFVRGKGGHITFDGFLSLQGGADPQRNRTLALLARGGDKHAIAKKAGRLVGDIPSTDDMPVRSGSRVQALIRDMAKNAPNKPFIIKKNLGMAPGLYRIRKGKGYLLSDGRTVPALQIVQHFGRKPIHSRWQWMQESMKRLLQHAPMQKMWNVAITKAVDDAVHKAGLQTTSE